jgi:hypothetical protein
MYAWRRLTPNRGTLVIGTQSFANLEPEMSQAARSLTAASEQVSKLAKDIDRLVGQVVAELAAQHRLDSTYLMLISDHGHLGGQRTHLARFDLADEFFFSPRQVTRDGRWVGGGLGLSVRQHRTANWHSGDKAGQFVFVDGDSDGAARIFLPRGNYRSGEWTGANSAAELLAYRVAGHLDPINLPATLANAKARHDNGNCGSPIDLVLMKLDDESILITTCDRGQAVVRRRRTEQDRWEYRYIPVTGVSVAGDGGVVCQEIDNAKVDPLGLVQRLRPVYFKQFHDESTWLWVTATSDYPDAVVTLTRHMLWQEGLKVQEREYAPDLVVTAIRALPSWEAASTTSTTASTPSTASRTRLLSRVPSRVDGLWKPGVSVNTTCVPSVLRIARM